MDGKPSVKSRSPRLCRALCPLCLLAALPAGAVEYAVDGTASAGGIYNTNIFLTPLGHTDVWGNILEASSRLTASTETWQVDGSGRLQNYWYTTPSLDSFNQFLNLNGHYQLSERNRLGLKGDYAHDSTMSSLADVNEVVFRRVRRNREMINPSWTYLFSEQTALSLDYQYNNIRYSNHNQILTFANSKTNYGALSLVHQYSPRLTLTGLLNFTNYETPGSTRSLPAGIINGVPNSGTVDNITEQTTINYGSLVVGGAYKVSETFDVSLNGGEQYSHTLSGQEAIFRDNQGNSRVLAQQHGGVVSWGYLLSAMADKRFDTSELKFEYNRTISPNIYGKLITDDRFTFTATHQLTTELDALARIVYSDRSAGDPSLLSLNRRYFKAQADLSWEFLENWYVVGSYQYSQQEFDIISLVPDSHAAYLTVKYSLDKIKY